MNIQIEMLKKDGMLFSDECSDLCASHYINYCKTWSMLQDSTKLFSNYIHNNDKETPYKGICFYEVIQAEKLSHYYNNFLNMLEKEFTHNLKILMNRVYNTLEAEDMELVDNFVNNYNFISREEIVLLDDALTNATTEELVDIYNNCLCMHQDVINVKLHKKICDFKTYNDQYHATISEIENLNINLEDIETNYLLQQTYRNYCFSVMKVLVVTFKMLDVHPNLKIRQQHFYNKVSTELNKCDEALKSSNKYNESLYTHLNIIKKTLASIEV